VKYRDTVPWIDPLRLGREARRFGGAFVLLHSSQEEERFGRRSYLACDPVEQIDRFDRKELAKRLSSSVDCSHANSWFGYLGYELLRHAEPTVPVAARAALAVPEIWLCRFRRIYVFDHEARQVSLYTEDDAKPPFLLDPREARARPLVRVPPLAAFRCLMPAGPYLRNVAAILEHIRAGDVFQANLTRKFVGLLASVPDWYGIYARMCAVAPALYGAYLETPFATILSSSPECFLQIGADGAMRTAPIKGSAGRNFRDPGDDAARKAALAASEKDRAENLMIADLSRNDLARSCLPGSVRAEELCSMHTYASIHHMRSVLVGRKRGDVSTFDAVLSAFPPGSMTGAPKIEAMRLCHAYERLRRGVYAGAIGRFGGDGSADFSVVIRTILAKGPRFECQTGGGIVADSNPYRELEETAAKLRGTAEALRARERMMRACHA
jgi:para-aminobenzoate synthetase component 1